MSLGRVASLLALAASVLAADVAAGVGGGRVVNRSQWPWFVTLGEGAGAECGAVLISPRRVLTSATCASGRGDHLHFVGFGRTTTGAAEHPRFARHERMTASDRDCPLRACAPDLAVLWLDRPVRSVQPVALAAPRPGPAVMIGVGLYERGSGKLRQADMLIRNTPRCTQVYRRLFGPHTMLCAVNHHGAVPCSSDLGGPLLQFDGARWSVVGVISHWGRHIDCGNLDHPVLFAKTDRFRDFLYDRRLQRWPEPHGDARISGAARVGASLRCSPPRFTPRPLGFSFRWVGTDETTDATYEVQQDDVGNTLTCLVDAWNRYGSGVASGEREVP